MLLRRTGIRILKKILPEEALASYRAFRYRHAICQIPRVTSATSGHYIFDLADATTQASFVWQLSECTKVPSSTGLRLKANGPDPWLVTPFIDCNLRSITQLQLTLQPFHQKELRLKIYFRTDQDTIWDETKSLTQSIPYAYDGTVTLVFALSQVVGWSGTGVQLRFDLENHALSSGLVEICRVELRGWLPDRIRWSSPPMPPAVSQPFHFLLALESPEPTITTLTSDEYLQIENTPHPARLTGPHAKACWQLCGQTPGLHALQFHTTAAEPVATTDVWIRELNGTRTGQPPFLVSDHILNIQPCSDSPGFVQVVPSLAVSIVENGALQRHLLLLTPVPTDHGCRLAGERTIHGHAVKATVSLQPIKEPGGFSWELEACWPDTWKVAEVELPTFLIGEPGLGARKTFSLLPGVEMLGDSMLPRHLDRSPQSCQLCWPMVYLEQAGLHYSISWHTPELTPLFTPPDLINGAGRHRLTLFYRPATGAPGLLQATGQLDISTQSRAEAIFSAGRTIFPPFLSPTPQEIRHVFKRSADALATIFLSSNGFTTPTLGATEEWYDPLTTLGFLFGSEQGIGNWQELAQHQVARCSYGECGPAYLTSLALLFPDSIQQIRSSLADEVHRLLRDTPAQHPSDGQRVSGCHAAQPYLALQTAAALAENAITLLYGYGWGLCEAKEIKELLAKLADRALIPCGGQWWEFAPDVPDLLAIQKLAEAWLLAACCDIDSSGMANALDWISLGCTFFHPGWHLPASLTRENPLFAAVPALGVTREPREDMLWYSHHPDDMRDWRGISCPWVALRFCNIIEQWLLYNQTTWPADTTDFLRNMCCRVFQHTSRLQLPDGGIPDGFDPTRGCVTEPLYRAPIELVQQAMNMLGMSAYPGLAANGRHFMLGVGRICTAADPDRSVIWTFYPASANRQALLVSSSCTVETTGRRHHQIPLTDHLGYVHISGADVVTIRSKVSDMESASTAVIQQSPRHPVRQMQGQTCPMPDGLPPTIRQNAALSRLDRMAARDQVAARPQSIYLDISNRCNLNCIICPYHNRDMRQGEIMPKELFFALGHELFPTARVVYLYGGGEALLHPDWDELFDFARQWPFLPVVSTNGMPLHPRRVAALVEAGTSLRISFDGADAATFNNIRTGADFHRVVENISMLSNYRSTHAPSGRCCLRFSVTAFDANIRQAPDIVELASTLGVEQVFFHHLMTDRNLLEGHQLSHVPDVSDEFFAKAVQKGIERQIHVVVPSPFFPERDHGKAIIHAQNQIPPNRLEEYFRIPLGPDKRYTCHVPWVETWIKPNGLIAPCCMSAQEYPLGDATQGGFLRYWNGDAYRSFRQQVNTVSPPAICSCDACVYRSHQMASKRIHKGAHNLPVLDSRCPGHLHADIRLLDSSFSDGRLRADLCITNLGDTRWLTDDSVENSTGCVRLGLRAKPENGEPDFDIGRVVLPATVEPGATVSLTCEHPVPAGIRTVELDLVAEGVVWFAECGSTPVLIYSK